MVVCANLILLFTGLSKCLKILLNLHFYYSGLCLSGEKISSDENYIITWKYFKMIILKESRIRYPNWNLQIVAKRMNLSQSVQSDRNSETNVSRIMKRTLWTRKQMANSWRALLCKIFLRELQHIEMILSMMGKSSDGYLFICCTTLIKDFNAVENRNS